VYLIFRLTKVFDGLIARVVDSDGEFLLIEAADDLPLWANPETCQDRVFIHDGDIHVIRERGTSFPNLLDNIHGKPHISRMSEKVQLALQRKIGVYPDEIRKRRHKARAFLPEKAASILRLEPRFIAPVIRMICHSDPLERRVMDRVYLIHCGIYPPLSLFLSFSLPIYFTFACRSLGSSIN